MTLKTTNLYTTSMSTMPPWLSEENQLGLFFETQNVDHGR